MSLSRDWVYSVLNICERNCTSSFSEPCVAFWLPLVSPSIFMPVFRLVRRAEPNNARTFTGAGIVLGCHKLMRIYATPCIL